MQSPLAAADAGRRSSSSPGWPAVSRAPAMLSSRAARVAAGTADAAGRRWPRGARLAALTARGAGSRRSRRSRRRPAGSLSADGRARWPHPQCPKLPRRCPAARRPDRHRGLRDRAERHDRRRQRRRARHRDQRRAAADDLDFFAFDAGRHPRRPGRGPGGADRRRRDHHLRRGRAAARQRRHQRADRRAHDDSGAADRRSALLRLVRGAPAGAAATYRLTVVARRRSSDIQSDGTAQYAAVAPIQRPRRGRSGRVQPSFFSSSGHDLEQVAHQAVVGDLEDRRLLVLVDRDDDLASPSCRRGAGSRRRCRRRCRAPAPPPCRSGRPASRSARSPSRPPRARRRRRRRACRRASR